MSSTDQAFIQAYARRKRGSVKKPTQTERKIGSANSQAGAERSPLRVWVDPLGNHARADNAEASAPRPHVEQDPDSRPATERSVNAMHHIHTAYASAFSDVLTPDIAPAVAAQAFSGQEIAMPGRLAPPVAEAQAPEAPAPQAPAPQAPAPRQPASDPPIRHQADRLHDEIFNRADPGHQHTPAPTNRRNLEVAPPNSATPTTARSTPAQVQAPFQAAWEVDAFEIPANVVELFFEPILFQQIAERIATVVSSGLGSILVTSTKPGEGRSSVAMGLAMAAAATGIRVVLIDADTEHPTLADELRLDLEYGWIDTIRGGLPIKEIAVHAIEDGVTLIPLMPPQGQGTATAYEVSKLIDSVKDKFELVIVDGPSGASMNLHQCAAAVDSAIIVRDVNGTDSLSVNEFASRLTESGVRGVGLVENFS